jgi:pSer/pThr/pTyr-binding forkhead associated (FHA) protein
VITCPKCSKENQDHYKFCLGCGAELPRDAAPKAFSPQTPPQGMRAAAQAPAMAATAAAPPRPAAPVSARAVPAAQPMAAPQAAPAAAGVTCPQCGHTNSPSNKFCAACGYNMSLVAAAAAPSAAPAPVPAAGGATTLQVLLTALRADGSEAGTFALPANITTVGRDIGGIFAGDSYLSPRHATFSMRGNKLFIKDEVSLNGVYMKLTPEAPIELNSGDIFRIGQEIIRFEVLTQQPASADGVERLGSPSKGYIGRVSLLTGRDTTGNAFPVPETGLAIGRERGDVLFPEDGYVSGLHCRITWESGKILLTDFGSSNGTFIRLFSEVEVRNQDTLLMGQQLFRIGF